MSLTSYFDVKVQILTLQKPHIPASLNMHSVINKCITAVKFSKFSGHNLRDRSTLDIGVLGYIGTVQHKENSPEILSIPSGTFCIIHQYILHTYIRTYIHLYIRKYIIIYICMIHKYLLIYTYIHTYIHTYIIIYT